MGVLKHHADALAAQACAFRLAQRCQVPLQDEHLPLCRVIQADQDVEQRCLARS